MNASEFGGELPRPRDRVLGKRLAPQGPRRAQWIAAVRVRAARDAVVGLVQERTDLGQAVALVAALALGRQHVAVHLDRRPWRPPWRAGGRPTGR